jgi:hypothetical protein
MRCRYLKKWVIARCEAGEEGYTPSIFQLHEYCHGRDHRKCPFYLLTALRDEGDPLVCRI